MNWSRVGYKDWLGLVASVIFWLVSIIFFVYGLAIENKTGISIAAVDLVFFISFGLSLSNTIVQIIGNDQTREDLGFVLWAGWVASYMLGVGSNVNFLYQLVAIVNPYVKFMVCVGLGIMVEVIPERLFVRFLRAGGRLSTPNTTPAPKPVTEPKVPSSIPRKPNIVIPQSDPKLEKSQAMRRQTPEYSPIPTRREMTDEPDLPDMDEELPPFMRKQHERHVPGNPRRK